MNNNAYNLTEQDDSVLSDEESPNLGQLCRLLGVGLREPKSIPIFVEGLRAIERRVHKIGLVSSFESCHDFQRGFDLLHQIPYWYRKETGNDEIVENFLAFRSDINLKVFKKGIRRALFRFYGTDVNAVEYTFSHKFLSTLTILFDLLDELG